MPSDLTLFPVKDGLRLISKELSLPLTIAQVTPMRPAGQLSRRNNNDRLASTSTSTSKTADVQ